MQFCPKCSKTYNDESKICRQCGAILEKVDPQLRDDKDVVDWLTDEQQSHLIERSGIDIRDSSVPGRQPLSDEERGAQQTVRPATGSSAWKCPKCREIVEPNFDVCWNCGTSRDGTEDPHFVQFKDEHDELAAAPEKEELAPETSSRIVATDLGCPVCGEMMTSELRLECVIHVCPSHGTWLFRGALEEMLWKFSRADATQLDQALAENRELRRRLTPD